MKRLATLYSFDAADKTVTLTGLNIPLNQVLLIVSQARVLYSLYDDIPAESYVRGGNSVLTLQDADGLNNSSPLTILYEDGTVSPPTSYRPVQLRRDAADIWELVNPTLLDGEMGFERDTLMVKVGDGLSDWNNLPYYSPYSSYTQVPGLPVTLASILQQAKNYADSLFNSISGIIPDNALSLDGISALTLPDGSILLLQ